MDKNIKDSWDKIFLGMKATEKLAKTMIGITAKYE